MNVSGVSNTQNTNNALTNAANGELGKDQFLHLLVTQLKQQDPLNPVQNQDLAAQLAQFSSVEQLENVNDKIEEGNKNSVVLSQTINNTLATNLIGKEVTAVGNQVNLKSDETMDLHFQLAEKAKSVNVTIKDKDGKVVREIEANGLSAGTRSVEWDGKDANGNILPEGTYSFEVAAIGTNDKAVETQALIKGRAEALQFVQGNAVFKIGGITINFGDVLEISSGVGV